MSGIGRRACAALVAAIAAASASTERADGAWDPGPSRYGVVAERNVPITMSDGVVLKGDVYRPADPSTGLPAEGTFPVIVTLTPYRKALTDPVNAWISRGYLQAIVDIRGTGTSGGRFGFFDEREQNDGPEVVRWAAKLPGANGKVGMFGQSYLGITQMNTAERMGRHSPLKAIVPEVATNDLYRDFGAPGGMFATVFDVLWFGGLRPAFDTVVPPEDLLEDPVGAFRAYLERTGNITGTDLPLLADTQLSGTKRFDGPYWAIRSPGNHLAAIVRNKVAALLIGGWSDVFQRGEPLNYAGLQNAVSRRATGRPMTAHQRVSPQYQLVDGPWFHQEADQGANGTLLALRWFDTWLKGHDTGMQRERSPLHLYEYGSGRWVDVARWPIRGAAVKTFYLRAGMSGTASSLNDGVLDQTPPTDRTGEDAQPYSAIPQSCARMTVQYVALVVVGAFPCIGDDRPGQPTALTYTTKPFTQRTSIAGPMTATLYARTDRPETATIVAVEDVFPDGRSLPLTGGQLLGSFRARDGAREWRIKGKLVMPYHPFTEASRRSMATGRIERLDVEVLPVLASLAPGHRLRLTITSNLAPILMAPPQDIAGMIGGTARYQRTAAYASHINIPMIPSDRLPTSSTTWGTCISGCRPAPR